MKDAFEEFEQDPEFRQIKLMWVKDTRGVQGEVLFDGKVYWMLRLDKESGRFFNISLTALEWAARNKSMDERRAKK
jgi:hypothetical protein